MTARYFIAAGPHGLALFENPAPGAVDRRPQLRAEQANTPVEVWANVIVGMAGGAL